MEPFITPTLLASTGMTIPDDQVSAFLDYLNEQLEERIGEAVVNSLNEQSIEELATMQETASDQEVQAWLQSKVTDLSQIIQDEVDILLGDAVEHKDAFNASFQADEPSQT